MYGKITRGEMEAYKKSITDTLHEHYGIAAHTIVEAKRGYYGETWQTGRYFIKIDYGRKHQGIFRNSLAVLDYIISCGMDFVGGIVRTTDGCLYREFSGGVLAVFDFLEGEHTEDYPLTRLFEKLAQIYKLHPPEQIMAKEDFIPREYIKFEENIEKFKSNITTCAERKLVEFLQSKRELIQFRAGELERYAEICRGKANLRYIISNGDAGGNVIINEKFNIIDWDEVMLAPPERDMWFFVQRGGQIDAQRGGQIEEIAAALSENGFAHVPDYDIMAYYCYYFFFSYQNQYLYSYFDFPQNLRDEVCTNMMEYYSCWIESCMAVFER